MESENVSPDVTGLVIKDKNEIIQWYNKKCENKVKYTNCYFSIGEFLKWTDEEMCFLAYNTGFIFVIFHRGYYKLFFYCDTLEWVKDIDRIKKIRNISEVAIEVLSKTEGELSELSHVLQTREINGYTRYRRVGNPAEEREDTENITYCDHEDLNDVMTIMKDTFLPVGNELLDISEIETYIDDKKVICIKSETDCNGGVSAELLGYLIFEDKGKTSYVRNVCVNPKYRGKGIGKRLLNLYNEIHKGYKVFTLWCNDNNIRALKLYEWAGYCNEGLHNTIYVC